MNLYTQNIFSFFPKLFLIIYLCLSGINPAQGQACTICSQSEVDNYTGNLVGNIVISGPDITNLDSLYDNISNSGFFIWGLSIINNPILTDISGISLIDNLGQAEVVISNNPLLGNISFPILLFAEYYFNIINNASLDSIYLPQLSVPQLTIEDNPSLQYIGLTADTWTTDLTISNNTSLNNLDGMSGLVNFTTMVITNNAQLRFYCALRDIVLYDPAADITITGNLKNPTFEEIILEGTCGNYVRDLIGYPTLAEALVGADDYDFIYVERDNTIDTTTTFLGIQKHTLVIRPEITLTSTASFINEGIIINHGIIEMMAGAIFTNSGTFIITGQLISN